MYIESAVDLYQKARAYLGYRAQGLSISEGDGYAKILLYSSELFRLHLPDPRYRTLSFVHLVSEQITVQTLLGVDLAFIENTKEEVEAAFDVLDRYARLRLPDKFLEAYDALPRDDS